MERPKFTYSFLEKALEKQIKTIEDHGRKQIDVITYKNERLSALTNKKCIQKYLIN